MVVMAIEAVKQETFASERKISGFFMKEGQFIAPITIGETIQTATETVLHLRPIQNAYEKDQTWYEIIIFSYRDERWTQCFRADVQVQYEEATKAQVDGGRENQLWQEQHRKRFQQASESCQRVVNDNTFYEFCADHGFQYGESFRLLRDIGWDGHEQSTAHIDMTGLKEHQIVDSPVHPAVLDAGIHLLLVQISKGLAGQISTFVPQRLGNTWVSAKPWGHATSSLHLTSFLRERNHSSENFKGSLWALADDGSPLCAVEEVVLTEVSTPSQPEYGPGDETLLYNIAWKPQLSSLNGNELLQLCNHAAQGHDEIFEDRWFRKTEIAMRAAARKALRDLKEADIERASPYMQRYVASLRVLYTTPSKDETESISDVALDSVLHDYETENPDCGIFLQIGRMLPSILCGETNPLEQMFATKSAETLYNYLTNQQMRDGRFETFLDLASHETPTLRILEVGAGTGSMTRHILGALQRFEEQTGQSRFASYTYTDISPTFFEAAQEKFGDFQGRIVYKTLDLECDPVEQGFEVASYDLVIAGLVFHATSSLEATMGRVRQLLRPGGHLAFQEVTNTESACANVTFGSLPGWWLSTEDWRQYTPLLMADRWGQLLSETGFSGADLVLRDYESEACHLCSMIVSKADHTTNTNSNVAPADDDASDHNQKMLSLIVNPKSACQRTLARDISEQYSNVQTLYVDDFMKGGWVPLQDDCVVSLLEVDMTLLSNLSEPEFGLLQILIGSVQDLLWVSSLPTVDGGMADPLSAVATGFFRSIQSEAPEKHIVTLVAESGSPEATANHVLYILNRCFWKSSASAEIDFVVHNGCLTIGRLMKEVELDAERLSRVEPQLRTESWKPGPPLSLEVGTPGMLDTLRWVEDAVHNDDLDPAEVEVEAVAWPISFRDVFVALGRLGMTGFGVECAGLVSRVGQACEYDMKPGDRVVMLSVGCMRSHPRAPAIAVVKIPDSLPFNEAVAAINPGITAYHSLINVARLQPGEKVLIHSGAGSTGQMAIAIAKWIGAEVFTTVGFDEKKQLLIDQLDVPDDHIFYSRNTSFAKGIMRVNRGLRCRRRAKLIVWRRTPSKLGVYCAIRTFYRDGQGGHRRELVLTYGQLCKERDLRCC